MLRPTRAAAAAITHSCCGTLRRTFALYPCHPRTGCRPPRLTTPRAAAASGPLDEPILARAPTNPDADLVNDDFKPTLAGERNWNAIDYAAFWVTLVISITSYYLAASLVDLGMSWWQGILTIFVGNVFTLVPMVLNAHPGTKYGIPFPVLARSSYGIRGANLPSLSRALVACGWFGIQTWVGGQAIYQILNTLTRGGLAGLPLPFLDISLAELACFLAFWAAQVLVVLRGMDAIRDVEKYSAPTLIALSVALLAWAVGSAGGLGPMLSTPSQFGPGMPRAGEFWAVFWPSVTANVGYWATLSLNIPDFSRHAVSQRAQLVGQALGLPLFMALFSLLGLCVTSATVVMYGAPIVDPVQLLGKMQGALPICLSLFGLMWATLTTNIAANVVAPANAFVNCAPSRISFNTGALITAGLGVAIMPWRLMSSTTAFLNTWLVGYSILLGPILGVVMADYWLVRHRRLDVDALYRAQGSAYWYTGGWNLRALAATLIGCAPCVPGFLGQLGLAPGLAPVWRALYDVSMFVGVSVACVTYVLLMHGAPGTTGAPQAVIA